MTYKEGEPYPRKKPLEGGEVKQPQKAKQQRPDQGDLHRAIEDMEHGAVGNPKSKGKPEQMKTSVPSKGKPKAGPTVEEEHKPWWRKALDWFRIKKPASSTESPQTATGKAFDMDDLLGIIKTGEFNKLRAVGAIRIMEARGDCIASGRPIPQKIAEAYATIEKYKPKLHKTYVDNAAKLRAAGNHKTALVEIENALICDPSHLDVWLQAGDCATAAGKPADARLYYSLVAKYSGPSPGDRRTAGIARHKLNSLTS